MNYDLKVDEPLTDAEARVAAIKKRAAGFKNCPFCNEPLGQSEGMPDAMTCLTKDCFGGNTVVYIDDPDDIAAWNRRAIPPSAETTVLPAPLSPGSRSPQMTDRAELDKIVSNALDNFKRALDEIMAARETVEANEDWQAGFAAGREAADNHLTLTIQAPAEALRLAYGEMTPADIRLLRSVLSQQAAAIRSIPTPSERP